MLRCYPLGDSGIHITMAEEPCAELVIHINAVSHHLMSIKASLHIIECVPGLTSLSVYYNPLYISYTELVSAIQQQVLQLPTKSLTTNPIMEVPVFYGGRYGPDLTRVSQYTGLSEDEVIEQHARQLYVVYMMGFLPGFPYMGDLPPVLEVPRLNTPRTHVPAGSVGIAGKHTGIYPLDSPGGWHIIGYTPLTIFNPKEKQRPILFEPGQRIRFKPKKEE
jgi:inhibitor of KinA